MTVSGDVESLGEIHLFLVLVRIQWEEKQKKGGFIFGMVCIFIYIYICTIHQVLRKSNNNRDSCGFQISKQNSNQETSS